MTFYEIDPLGFPAGSEFFFNVVISTIAISFESDILPVDVYDYWYLGGIKESRPFAIYIYRNSGKSKFDNNFDVETYTHCVLELDKDQTICWYDMVEYETEDPWDPTPILEDFDDWDEENDNYE